MQSLSPGRGVALRVAAAVSLLLAWLVCLHAGEADAHLIGSHGGVAAHHSGTHDMEEGLTLGTPAAHPECGDEVMTATPAGGFHPEISFNVAGTAREAPQAITTARSGVLIARGGTGSPPTERVSLLPLRI